MRNTKNLLRMTLCLLLVICMLFPGTAVYADGAYTVTGVQASESLDVKKRK